MKVNIGPYRGWLSTHKLECLYLEYMYGDRWVDIGEKDYTWYDKLVLVPLDFINKLFVKKLNRNRKVEIKYHPYDTFSLDHTLALIILPGLKQLKETNHGFSTVDNEDVPVHLRCEEKEDWGSLKGGEERWNWVMDEMIWAFTQIVDEYPEDFSTGETDYQWGPAENGLYKLNYGPKHTYSVDWDAKKAYDDRIANGTRLFGKYFRSLWD